MKAQAPSPSPPILSIQLEYLEDNHIQLTVTKEVERRVVFFRGLFDADFLVLGCPGR
jgi:hypothetical protein